MGFNDDFVNLLNVTAKVYTKTYGTPNAFGEKSFALSESIDELKCTIQPIREEQSFTLHGTTYVIRDAVYCAYRTDIYPGNVLEANSIQYLIVSVMNDGGQDNHTKLYITKA